MFSKVEAAPLIMSPLISSLSSLLPPPSLAVTDFNHAHWRVFMQLTATSRTLIVYAVYAALCALHSIPPRLALKFTKQIQL